MNSKIHSISKTILNSPSRFKKEEQKYIQDPINFIKEKFGIIFDFDELGDLLLSICRANDSNVIKTQKRKLFRKEENVLKWIEEKLIPNTVTMSMGEEDVIRLLIFCIEITYQMFEGGTKATVTQKGFRERRRTFESILIDQFVGKLGEIIVKKFFEKNFLQK